ncbi:MAG: M48 family metalloprotease [Armatimonadota bacterium]
MIKHRNILLILVACVLLSCGGASAIHDSSQSDPQSELETGQRFAKEVRESDEISHNPMLQERVERIGRALLEKLDVKEWSYEFHVVKNQDINAFAIQGGFIYINEGLLAKLHDDNALAWIIAHEIIHAAHHHYVTNVDKMAVIKLLAVLTSIKIKDRKYKVARLICIVADRKYSRDSEWDADTTGLELAWKAGYDPKAALVVQQVFMELDKGNTTPNYLRTHPKPKDRYAHAAKLADELMKKPRLMPVPAVTPAPAVLAGDLQGLTPTDTCWFPLAVGNEWTYLVEGKGGQSSYTLRVVGAVPTPSGTIYRVETLLGNTTVSCQLLTTGAEVWRRARPTTVESPWKLEHIFEFTAADPVVKDGNRYQLVGLEEVSVPCGTFTGARHIRRTGEGEPLTMTDLWFVPKVGLVKRVNLTAGVTETLVRYQVAAEKPAVVAETAEGAPEKQ